LIVGLKRQCFQYRAGLEAALPGAGVDQGLQGRPDLLQLLDLLSDILQLGDRLLAQLGAIRIRIGPQG
jgi:hypothetical protein